MILQRALSSQRQPDNTTTSSGLTSPIRGFDGTTTISLDADRGVKAIQRITQGTLWVQGRISEDRLVRIGIVQGYVLMCIHLCQCILPLFRDIYTYHVSSSFS